VVRSFQNQRSNECLTTFKNIDALAAAVGTTKSVDLAGGRHGTDESPWPLTAWLERSGRERLRHSSARHGGCGSNGVDAITAPWMSASLLTIGRAFCGSLPVVAGDHQLQVVNTLDRLAPRNTLLQRVSGLISNDFFGPGFRPVLDR
jgi:hypothetical protein